MALLKERYTRSARFALYASRKALFGTLQNLSQRDRNMIRKRKRPEEGRNPSAFRTDKGTSRTFARSRVAREKSPIEPAEAALPHFGPSERLCALLRSALGYGSHQGGRKLRRFREPDHRSGLMGKRRFLRSRLPGLIDETRADEAREHLRRVVVERQSEGIP